MYNIAVIPGDGIGREVMDACIKVLDSLDIDFNFSIMVKLETNVLKRMVKLCLMKQ